MYGFYIEDSSRYNGISSYSNYFNVTQRNSSAVFVKPTPAVFADSATASSWNVTVTSSAAANAAPGGKGGGLSDGAKAGIGIGAACVALNAVGLAVLYWTGNRRSATRVPPVTEAATGDSHGKAELPESTG